MKQLIYKHTCTITNESYIGQTIYTMEERLNAHLSKVRNGSYTHFHNALRKYGIENFTSEILEDNIPIQSDIITKQTLSTSREIYYINEYNTCHNGYNMTEGGEGSLGVEPWNKGTKGLQKAWNKGIKTGPMTNEQKESISNTLKKRYENTVHLSTGKVPWNKGLNTGPAWNKGLKADTKPCPHCGKEVNAGNFTRWHGDKCKHKSNH